MDHPHAGGPVARLAVDRLTITDFRSYPTLRLAVDPRPVVLTGANGAGKTNLLEALSLLAPGRGLRRARLVDLDRAGGGPWQLEARLEGRRGPFDVASGRVVDSARERRTVAIDGTAAAAQDLGALVSIVWLTPAMDRLFAGNAAERRRFLDRLVMTADPGHGRQLARYSHAVRERARLLRARRIEPAWLAAIETQAAAAGVAIAAARRQTVEQLNAALAADRGAFPRAELGLAGDVERWLATMSALDAETGLAERLASERTADAATGTTACGPHRSDLDVRDPHTGRPARDSSTGQQKALLISIMLAAARVRAAADDHQPILLLDEIGAHLDDTKRRDLFAELSVLGAQAWLTGTDAAVFAPLGERAQHFVVEDFKLHRYDPA